MDQQLTPAPHRIKSCMPLWLSTAHCMAAVCAEGAKSERAYAKDGTVPDPTSTDNPEFQIVLGMIRDGLKKNPTKWTKYAEALQGRLPSLLIF